MEQIAIEKSEVDAAVTAPPPPPPQEVPETPATPLWWEGLNQEEIDLLLNQYSPIPTPNDPLAPMVAGDPNSAKGKRKMTEQRLSQLAKAREAKKAKREQKLMEIKRMEEELKQKTEEIERAKRQTLEGDEVKQEVTVATSEDAAWYQMKNDTMQLLKLGLIVGTLVLTRLLTPKPEPSQSVPKSIPKTQEAVNILLRQLQQ